MNNLKQLALAGIFYLNDFDDMMLNRNQNTVYSYAIFLTGGYRYGAQAFEVAAAYAEPRSGIFFCPSNRYQGTLDAMDDVPNWASKVYGLYMNRLSTAWNWGITNTYPSGGSATLYVFNQRKLDDDPGNYMFFADSSGSTGTMTNTFSESAVTGNTTNYLPHLIHNDHANVAFHDGHVESVNPSRLQTVGVLTGTSVWRYWDKGLNKITP